jgi:hypothetical protein
MCQRAAHTAALGPAKSTAECTANKPTELTAEWSPNSPADPAAHRTAHRSTVWPPFRPAQPSVQPTRQPTGQPASLPSAQPTRQPTSRPSTQPTRQPSSAVHAAHAVPNLAAERSAVEFPAWQPSGATDVTAQPPADRSAFNTALAAAERPNEPTAEQFAHWPADHPAILSTNSAALCCSHCPAIAAAHFPAVDTADNAAHNAAHTAAEQRAVVAAFKAAHLRSHVSTYNHSHVTIQVSELDVLSATCDRPSVSNLCSPFFTSPNSAGSSGARRTASSLGLPGGRSFYHPPQTPLQWGPALVVTQPQPPPRDDGCARLPGLQRRWLSCRDPAAPALPAEAAVLAVVAAAGQHAGYVTAAVGARAGSELGAAVVDAWHLPGVTIHRQDRVEWQSRLNALCMIAPVRGCSCFDLRRKLYDSTVSQPEGCMSAFSVIE